MDNIKKQTTVNCQPRKGSIGMNFFLACLMLMLYLWTECQWLCWTSVLNANKEPQDLLAFMHVCKQTKETSHLEGQKSIREA